VDFLSNAQWSVVVGGHLFGPRAHDLACSLAQREGGVSEFEITRISDERDNGVDVGFWMMFCFYEAAPVLAHAREALRVLEKAFEV